MTWPFLTSVLIVFPNFHCNTSFMNFLFTLFPFSLRVVSSHFPRVILLFLFILLSFHFRSTRLSDNQHQEKERERKSILRKGQNLVVFPVQAIWRTSRDRVQLSFRLLPPIDL